nr:3-oxoacyl-[acyl-carrier-protein] reductase FabG-like [Danaus plexippus plexippus]
MNFKNKVILITGAASGIGREIAIQFAKLSANLSLLDIDLENLKSVTEECRNLSESKVFTLVADLGKSDNVKTVVDLIKQEFGKIDVLVNNAGIARIGDIKCADLLKDVDNVLNINLISGITLTHYAAEALIESKGCIINIASIMAAKAGIGSLAYNVSKAAVLQFTKCVALELADSGVRVNCISPGSVKTNVLNNVLPPSEDFNKFWDDLIEDHPMRQLTTTEDIAHMAVFLASDKAKSITGCNYTVDSGKTLIKFASHFP